MISKRHRIRHVNRCRQRDFCNICNQYHKTTEEHYHASASSPQIDVAIWSLLYRYLPRLDWVNTALACQSSNKGLKMMMMNRYGDMNTWMADCPVFAHRWKCQHHLHGPMFPYIAPYPDAFKDPSSTNFRPKPLIVEGSEWVRFRLPEIVFGKNYLIYGNYDVNLLNEIKEENNYEYYYSDDE